MAETEQVGREIAQRLEGRQSELKKLICAENWRVGKVNQRSLNCA